MDMLNRLSLHWHCAHCTEFVSNKFSVSKLCLLFFLLCSGAFAAEHSLKQRSSKLNAPLHSTTSEKSFRKLASVEPSYSYQKTSQGEQMLKNVTESSPAFLKPGQPNSKVHYLGVCQNQYGITHTSYDRDYEGCLTSPGYSYSPGPRSTGFGMFITP